MTLNTLQSHETPERQRIRFGLKRQVHAQPHAHTLHIRTQAHRAVTAGNQEGLNCQRGKWKSLNSGAGIGSAPITLITCWTLLRYIKAAGQMLEIISVLTESCSSDTHGP